MIAGACALFYALAMAFGGDHHDLHHGDMGGYGGDGHHHGNHGGDHDSGTSFKEYFSIRSILLFGTGFGAAGAISTALGFGPWLIPIFAFLAGFFFSWTGIKLFHMLRRQEATTSDSLLELEGLTGQVKTAISPGSMGEVVVLNFRGEARYLRARSEDGGAIAVDEEVQVVSAATGELVVRKNQSLPPVA